MMIGRIRSTRLGILLNIGIGVAFLIAAYLCLVPTGLFAANSSDRSRSILIIPSYNFNYKGIQWFLHGTMAEFTERNPFKVTFLLENMQLAAHPSDRKYMDTMAASLKIKYSIEKPDLIIVQYKQALQFMERYGKEIFGDIPVVFAGLAVEGYVPDKLPHNYTGIIASFSAKKNIELIIRNHSNVRKIYVVGGTSPVEKDMVNEAIKEGKPFLGKIEFIAVTDMTFPALLAKLGNLKDNSAIMYQALQLDAAGKVFVPAQAAIEIASAASVPVYGMLDTYMGSGITGGFLINHEGLGRKAADIAMQLLQSGVTPDTRVKSEQIGSYRFDGRQLQRWGIDNNTLPSESKIEFKVFSLWDSYKKKIVGWICLILLQTILIIVLIRSRYRRIKTEEILRTNEAKQRAMIANIADVIAIIDQDGINRYKSPNIERLFGWRPEDVVGVSTWENVHPEDLERTQKFFGTLLGKPTNVAGTSECRYRCKDGSYKWIEFNAVNLIQNPDIRGILLNYHDITAHRHAEKEKQNLLAQLSQAQKMEAIGQLAGGVAHDFNNKLNIILGYTQMAMINIEPSNPINDNLQEIMNATRRSSDLVHQLLAFARKQTIVPKALDLNDTIESMLNMLRRLLGEQINLLWMPSTNLWPVKMDSSQIDQILANLAVNARDSISGVGKITIETGNAEFDEAYCAQYADFVAGQYVMLAVSDNGSGMDKETLDKIFEPFFTTKEVGKGTGMGLATVYGIVKQNNGFINVYSEPEKGSTFRIYLPRFAEEKTEPLDQCTHAEHLTGTETVLIVEDEEVLLKLGKFMLEELGYNVMAAGTPGEAIRMVGEHTGDIHLVLTDVVMPEMSGRDLQKRLDAIRPGMKYLYMSGYPANVINHHGVLDKGLCFLQKPFRMETLSIKTREALDK